MGARKKARCGSCTRPLPEGALGFLCPTCASKEEARGDVALQSEGCSTPSTEACSDDTSVSTWPPTPAQIAAAALSKGIEDFQTVCGSEGRSYSIAEMLAIRAEMSKEVQSRKTFSFNAGAKEFSLHRPSEMLFDPAAEEFFMNTGSDQIEFSFNPAAKDFVMGVENNQSSLNPAARDFCPGFAADGVLSTADVFEFNVAVEEFTYNPSVQMFSW